MRDPFARAIKGILALTGKDALLRGAPAGKVNIEHGVEVYERNAEGESAFTRSIATIEAVYTPKQGDALVLLDENGAPTAPTYKLARLLADTGYARRYIVVEG